MWPGAGSNRRPTAFQRVRRTGRSRALTCAGPLDNERGPTISGRIRGWIVRSRSSAWVGRAVSTASGVGRPTLRDRYDDSSALVVRVVQWCTRRGQAKADQMEVFGATPAELSEVRLPHLNQRVARGTEGRDNQQPAPDGVRPASWPMQLDHVRADDPRARKVQPLQYRASSRDVGVLLHECTDVSWLNRTNAQAARPRCRAPSPERSENSHTRDDGRLDGRVARSPPLTLIGRRCRSIRACGGHGT